MLFLLACAIGTESKSIESGLEDQSNVQEEQDSTQTSDETNSSDSDNSQDNTSPEDLPEDTPEDNPEDTPQDTPQDTPEEPPSLVNYALSGTFSVYERSESIQVDVCSMDLKIFEPSIPQDLPTVILSHGFARSADNMVDLASHYASWGFTVYVPNLCHASFLDADPEASAAELMEFAALNNFDEIIYAGYSNGGLVSLIAGVQDPLALGVVGLDPVDNMNAVGAGYASMMNLVPIYGLIGESSSCNSENNSLDFLSPLQEANLVRVNGSDHCDFEAPTNWMCTSFCSGSSAVSEEEIAETVRVLSTAALFSLSGFEQQWWDGVGYDDLELAGKVSPIQ
ncbi:MAG: hypothetical protein CMK59_04875 [Proteobacteria bacterium]|nr:hypothetical protein [Pseudomonadota bacterium]